MENFEKNLKKYLIIVKKYNIIGASKRQKGRRCEMELTKTIFFNTDKLIENSKVKISYTGKFYQDDSQNVIVHYGFGSQWNNVNDIEMVKTELGFQTEIELLQGESLELCFKNGNDEWDNNDGKNYVFQLEKAPQELVALDDEPKSMSISKKINKSYIWGKKIKLAVYKLVTYLPKVISGNYRKKANNED